MASRQLLLCAGFLVPTAAIMIVNGPAVAQNDYRGTQEQQFACTPDVFRLCGGEIPDVSRIVACLKANQARLSPACRAVFASDPRRPRPGVQPRREQRDYGRGQRDENWEQRDDNGGYDHDDED
jgi:hypothetical protein